MLKLIIEDDEGRKTVVPFVRDEITVGRQEGNTIRLTERNVSRRHARLLRSNGHVIVEDLGSYNGIRINGEKIQGKQQVRDGDTIEIGDYELEIQSDQQPSEKPPAPPPPSGEHAITPTNASAEPETDAEVPQAHAELASGDDEPTGPSAEAMSTARRQSTSVIRIDQVDGSERPRSEVADVDPADAPRLVILNTELAGREFACIRTELRIGRTEDNDIGIDHRSLSRTHAKVVREDNGEWRVLDMQSANGTSVNGETYGAATLRHGDVVTLGHVKLKFVGPGQQFRFVPGADYEKPPRSKLPLVVGAVVVLLVAGVGAFLLLRDHGSEPQPIPSPPVAEKPAPPEKPAEPVAVKPPEPEPAPVEKKPEPQTVEPAPQVAKVEEKIAGAKAAMKGREFEKAVDILDSIKLPDGSHPKKVEELLDQANAELLFKKSLASAQKFIDAGNLGEAARLIEESSGTTAFASELAKVKARLDKEQAKADAAAKTPPPDKANAKQAKASPSDEAKKLFDEGYAVLKSKQYPEAASIFRKCLDVDANYAKCHLYLGVSYAKLKNLEKGAFHYRQFVKLAPNDEEAPKVRKLLEQYEQSKPK